jgi:hypothetical protein
VTGEERLNIAAFDLFGHTGVDLGSDFGDALTALEISAGCAFPGPISSQPCDFPDHHCGFQPAA